MKPGIYRDMDAATYFADPCEGPSLSQSIAKVILEQSLLHANHEYKAAIGAVGDDSDNEEPEKYVKAQAIGDAAHRIIIGRGKTLGIIEADSFRSKEAKKEREAALTVGCMPILSKHYFDATKIAAEGRRQLDQHEYKDAFTNGSGEVVLIWQEDGVWFRSMLDWLHDDLRTVDDYKTSGMSMAPHLLGIRAESAGWHIQAAFIERGLDVLDPDNAGRRTFRFIAQEQYAPYAVSAMLMDEAWLTMGRKKVNQAVNLWKSAIKSGRWPGYPARGVTPEYPGYKEKQWLGRELSGEFEEIESLMGG
jgi:hypothetical protein